MKKNIIAGQSGGPTAVINASLYGIVTEAAKHPDKVGDVYGMLNGIEGFMQDRYMNLSQELSREELEILKTTPRLIWDLADISCQRIYPLPFIL